MVRKVYIFLLFGLFSSSFLDASVGRSIGRGKRLVHNLSTFGIGDYLESHPEIASAQVYALKNNSADVDLMALVQHPEITENMIVLDRTAGVLLSSAEEKAFLGHARNAQYFPNLVEFGFGWDYDTMPAFILALPAVRILRLVQCFGANVLPAQFPAGLEVLQFKCFYFDEMQQPIRFSQMSLPDLKHLEFTYCSGLEHFLDQLPETVEYIDWHTCYPLLTGEIPACVRALPNLKELHISIPDRNPQERRNGFSHAKKDEKVADKVSVVYPDFYNASGVLVKVVRTVFSEKTTIPV